ncbi:MAG: hypothetical protein R3F59_07985 [Myxococcota bacterium]
MRRWAPVWGCLAAASCGGSPSAWWVDQLQPDGPCYRVDLVDGLDTRSTDELHDLFACVNQQGAIDALAPADAAMDVQTRPQPDGTVAPAGIELAVALERLRGSDVDAFALGSLLVDALQAEAPPGAPRPVDQLLDLSLELTYGAPASQVRSGAVDLRDPEALRAGVVAPLAPVVPILARTLLDDDLAAANFLGEVLQDPETRRWLLTLVSIVRSEDPAVAGPLASLVPDLGSAVLAGRSPGNDRWPGASGDSLRDLLTFFVVRDHPVVEDISPAAHEILGDPAVRAALVPAIDALAADGSLAQTPEAVAWMASVDVDGTPLSPDELSSLYRFVRLLADNNHPVDCSIDLVVTTIDWQFDNLSLATLRLLAGLQPGEVVDLAGLVSDLTGSPLTQPLIDLAIDSGVCPSFTRQTMDDLRALEALQQPEALPLLTDFVTVLAVLQGGSTDHLPAFADLAEALFDAGGLEPAEEAIRDLGPTPVAEDLVALVEALAHPERHGVTAGGAPAPTLGDALALVDWAFAVDPAVGLSGLQRIRPWAVGVLDDDDGWVAGGNLARLAATPGTATADLLPLLATVADLDPQLTVLDDLGPVLADPEVAAPLLRIAERPDVVDALLRDTPAPGSGTGEVPLAFWGRLVVNGALQDVLRLFDTAVAEAR